MVYVPAEGRSSRLNRIKRNCWFGFAILESHHFSLAHLKKKKKRGKLGLHWKSDTEFDQKGAYIPTRYIHRENNGIEPKVIFAVLWVRAMVTWPQTALNLNHIALNNSHVIPALTSMTLQVLVTSPSVYLQSEYKQTHEKDRFIHGWVFFL